MQQHVHFIGIGGTGLSAIARVLLESGNTVSGSDQLFSSLAQDVQAAGAEVFVGHHARNLRGAEIVIRSSAVPDENPEVLAALDAGIPVLKRADFLGSLMEDRMGIAIAGSHGKTTTTAMLAWVLSALDQDPTFIVGGMVSNLGTNARAGKGKTFVIEADEYDHMFLGLKPHIAVVTNVEHDHPDIFPTAKDFQKAFQDFVRTLSPDGLLLACGDDPGSAEILAGALLENIHSLTYGIASTIYDYYATNLTTNQNGGFSFDAYKQAMFLAPVSLQVPGDHNVQNALAVLAVIDQLALPIVEASLALGEFQGAGRRFQVLDEIAGVIVIDDYAHHPTEIRATLAAARSRYPNRRIWAIWQPHTYSRTKLFFDEFTLAFADADHVLVTDIYRSREPSDANFSSSQVVAAMQNPQAFYSGTLSTTADFYLAESQPGDIVLVLSAGDATQISEQILTELVNVELKLE